MRRRVTMIRRRFFTRDLSMSNSLDEAQFRASSASVCDVNYKFTERTLSFDILHF